MDLSDIIVPDGLIPKPVVTCVVEGILEEDDLRELMLSSDIGTEPVADEDPNDLKKIREKHHSVARMIAGGLNQRMVSRLCRYNESYLSVLLNNPSMVELVELYRLQQGQASQLIVEKLKSVGLRAVEELEGRLDEGKLNNQELLALGKLGLDRGGHGPTSTQHNVTEQHVIDHAELVRLNKDARSRSAQRIVPAQEVRAQLPSPSSPSQETDSETNGTVGSEGSELHETREP